MHGKRPDYFFWVAQLRGPGLNDHREAALLALRGQSAHLATVLPDPFGSDLFAELERRDLLVPVAPSDASWIGSRLASVRAQGHRSHQREGTSGVARVLVLGVGGTGSVVLEHLVGGGPGQLRSRRLPNTVRAIDLERQFLFRRGDVGRSKVASATDYIWSGIQMPRSCRWLLRSSSPRKFGRSLPLAVRSTLQSVCIDHPPATAFRTVATDLWEAGVPFTHGGVMLQRGASTRTFLPEDTRLPTTVRRSFWDSSLDGEAEPTNCCFPPFNTVVAAHLAAERPALPVLRLYDAD